MENQAPKSMFKQLKLDSKKKIAIAVSALALVVIVVAAVLLITKGNNQNTANNSPEVANQNTGANANNPSDGSQNTGLNGQAPSNSPMNNPSDGSQNTGLNGQAPAPKQYSWSYNNNQWVSNIQPQVPCKSQFIEQTPADINLATAILYPGQVRSIYKAHGGFIFGNSKNADITVKLPMDAKLVNASRYYQNGEEQYLFYFLSDCGIAYKFDHLNTLSPQFQALADTLPQPKVDDTSTTDFQPVEYKAGTVIATAVGFKNTNNTSFDFGVYDYRQKNQASQDPAYASAHSSSGVVDFYAICWLNYLPGSDSAKAKALPGGDGKSGKQSDYCK